MISLGLDKPILEPKETRIKKTPAKPATKKRILLQTSEDDGGNKPPAKAQRVESDSTSGVRRSSRNVGKIVDYQNEVVKSSPVPISFSSGVKTSENSGPLGRQTGPREHDPLAFQFLINIFTIDTSIMTSEIFTARHLALFLELRLALGGKPEKAAVLTPFMRMHGFSRSRL